MRLLPLGLIAVPVVLGMFAYGCGTQRHTGLARGKELFKTCVPCHGEDGEGRLELRTPSIAGLPDWYLKAELTKFMTDVRGAHPDDIEGHRMRPMARTLYGKGDLDAVVAFVGRLHRAPVPPVLSGDKLAGQQHFTTVCVTCHGADAKGNEAMGAPPLVGQADWYLVSQLKKFKTGMRGANPQDATGMQMRAMSSTLADTTAMRNVVAYIQTLSHN